MFEPVTDDDVPTIVALMNRSYRGAGAAGGWNSEADILAGDRTTEAMVRADLSEKPEAAFLKWIDDPGGAISGCIWLEPISDGVWYLGSLTVDPARQNAGRGRAMLTAAEQWVGAHGGVRVRMTVVNRRDTLIAWYLRRGYRETGETEPFPYDDRRFGTPLRDDLWFVVLEKQIAETQVCNLP